MTLKIYFMVDNTPPPKKKVKKKKNYVCCEKANWNTYFDLNSR